MADIEAENPSLKGVLYREFSRLRWARQARGSDGRHRALEVRSEAARQPRHLRRGLRILPRPVRFERRRQGRRVLHAQERRQLAGRNPGAVQGKIYDPACGSGGMFVQSAKFKDAHQKNAGQEGRPCRLRPRTDGADPSPLPDEPRRSWLDGDIGQTYGSTFTNDQHKTLRADYILANPPFNIKRLGWRQAQG
jgi:type I restriction enzyme M protein